MENLKHFLIIPFLFAVTIAKTQLFNSIVSEVPINSIEVRKKLIRDTVVKFKVVTDTVFATHFPLKTPLTLSSLPMANIQFTSGFGYRVHPILGNIKFHNGIDLSARQANVYSVLHGEVSVSSYDAIIGNYIVINHGMYKTTYGHLSVRLVKAGDLVKAGSVIGISGRTGRVTGEHLHFIVKYKGHNINPLPFLKEILNVNHKDELTQFLTKSR
uniref:M23 family metallopeptidase n=1 Tax=Pedobacter sp. TaxID=1411316 RepID=UPI0015EEDF8A|nr:M23 family metallopeptidase [Pedobacter sp.]